MPRDQPWKGQKIEKQPLGDRLGKSMARWPGKVQMRVKETPRSSGRTNQKHAWRCRAHGWSVAEWPETQLSNFPWFGLFVLVWCFVFMLVVWQCSFFSFYSERIYLVAWFFCVLFPFRYRWRFLESREKGVSAWQNLSNSINARNLSEVWTSADWTKLNWSFDQHLFSDTCAAYA